MLNQVLSGRTDGRFFLGGNRKFMAFMPSETEIKLIQNNVLTKK